jgi:hypothetical protein
MAQGWVTAEEIRQKLLAPLALSPAISRCLAFQKRNIPNESKAILRVTELNSRRASVFHRRRTPRDI